MSCCGHKRALASAAAGARRRDASTASRRAASTARTTIGPLTAPGRAADVLVRYLGALPVRVRGAASGRIYHASPADVSLAVDARDAAALIRTGLFRKGPFR